MTINMMCEQSAHKQRQGSN